MPEYLAPGVYVEEKDTGAKAIEGVSTTTSGMVGVTERGPEGIPTLVIGFSDFRRQFGGLLDRRIYTGANWYLPHAVDGFFTNGGKRLYVVRVLPDDAKAAEAELFDRGSTGGAKTGLDAAANPDDTSLLVANVTGLTAGGWLKIDDGEATEYVEVKSTLPTFAVHGALQSPHADKAKVTAGSMVPSAGTDALAVNASAGMSTIQLALALVPTADTIIQIGAGNNLEFAVVKSFAASTKIVTLKQPLAFDHLTADVVQVLTFAAGTGTPTKLDGAIATNDVLFRVENASTLTGTPVVEFDGPGDGTEYRVVDQVNFLRLGHAVTSAHAVGSSVMAISVSTASAGNLTTDTEPSSNFIKLDFAPAANDVLQLGSGDTREIVVVVSFDSTTMTATLKEALQLVHPAGIVHSPSGAFVGGATLSSAIAAGDDVLPLRDFVATDYQAGYVVQIGTGTTVEYRLLSNLPSPISINGPLQFLHPANATLLGRSQMIDILAIDRGGWGNDLYVTVEDDDPTLDTFINGDAAIGVQQLELKSTVGIEVGTVLEVGYQRATPTADEVPGELQKVTNVTSTKVDLAAPLAVAVTQGARIRTREFRLSVALRQLNPNTGKLRTIESEGHRHLSMDPRHTRYFAKVIGHIWRNDIDTPRQADGRTQGESDLIRVEDVLLDSLTNTLDPSAESTIRLGPDLNIDTLPDGRVLPVPSKLSGGDDAIISVTKETYIGVDDLNPNDRRGLFALKNIEEISIVAIPGHTEQEVQQALLDHCELMRYRFAVLDAGPGEKIAEVQEHRSLYDSKYGAIYHPWLMIDDPFPDNPRAGGQIAIPPSGHVIGIYARSDIERGVHKAPANEVVRGIAGLEASLAKEHQDILNPRNINVIRNFRDANRGLRVWGARTLSSDPDWKYINVRRLFIFMEHSIDRGTQWVVFEPNSELLWQRVRRVISSFLRAVWRDGALMGLTPEEAYFVKCDRTTMSQSDIDNGRLIVEIGVAPVKPAEFVIFRIGQWTGGSSADEG
jgi:hypothetical protein